MAGTDTLLVEVLVEELPPLLLDDVSAQFARRLHRSLGARGFLADGAPAPRALATLRRLACVAGGVRAHTGERTVSVRGPAVDAAFGPDGAPTRAAEGFARSLGCAVGELGRATHRGREHLAGTRAEPGERLGDALAAMVAEALGAIEAPRLMRWADHEFRFLRPVRGSVLLHGKTALGGDVMGVQAGDTTRGHRQAAPGPVRIADADSYGRTMDEDGHVTVDAGARRQAIRAGLARIEKERGVAFLPGDGDGDGGDDAPELAANGALVGENAAMVERAFVLAGTFDRRHRALPRELIAACLQGQQKYFMGLDPASKEPAETFAFVSGMPDHPAIVAGNEKVVAARFADAEFFFRQDLGTAHAELDARLERTVHHHRLGSQGQRKARIAATAAALAARLGADPQTVGEAGAHALRDLASATVGEFPELQGRIMPHLLGDAERDSPAGAALRGYLDRVHAPGQKTQPNREAACLALAHQAELLVGLVAAGETPKGDSDPFGLRRCALGIIRVAIDDRAAFPLRGLLADAAAAHGPAGAGTLDECASFVTGRARNFPGLFSVGGAHQGWLAQATLGSTDDTLCWLPEKARALAAFAARPEARSLVEANKRIANIFRKSGEAPGEEPPDPALFAGDEERALHRAAADAGRGLAELVARGEFAQALELLAGLARPLDDLFTNVLVNDPDARTRENRFRLLGGVRRMLAGVADFSALVPPPPAAATDSR